MQCSKFSLCLFSTFDFVQPGQSLIPINALRVLGQIIAIGFSIIPLLRTVKDTQIFAGLCIGLGFGNLCHRGARHLGMQALRILFQIGAIAVRLAALTSC